jgi:hypothetical protein
MARQCGCDGLKYGTSLLPKNESIEGHLWSAVTYGDALSCMCSHAHPIETPIDPPTSRFRADSADTNHGVKSTPPNGAHTVLATEHAVGIRIERMRPLIDQYAHFIPLPPIATGQPKSESRRYSQTSRGITDSCTLFERSA